MTPSYPTEKQIYTQRLKRTNQNIKRAKTDMVFFMENFLNFCPRKDQIPVIKAFQEGKKRVLVCKGRRWGGTILSSAIDLTLASQKPGLKIGVFSPGWDETEVYMDAIRAHLDRSLIQPSVTESLKMSLRLSNGSYILGRVCSKTAQGKRGRGYDKLTFTEAAYIPDDELHVVRVAKLDNPNAMEMLESSPNGMNHFFKSSVDPDFKVFTFPSSMNPLISAKELKKERDLMTDIQARQELDAEFIDDSTAPFPQTLIDAAIRRSKIENYWIHCEQPGYYIAGVDLGRKRDRSVCTIIRILPKGDLQIVHIKEFLYNPDDPRFWSKIIDHLEYLAKEFKIHKMLVDCTGLGDKVVADMKIQFQEHKITTLVEGFNFSYASKNKWEGLINQLTLKFERYMIHFPFHLEFVRQLKSIRFDSKKALYESIGKSPDIVMATALAVRAAPATTSNFIYSKANKRSDSPKERGGGVISSAFNLQKIIYT